MASVASGVSPKEGEYNLVDSQESSEKSCWQKIKKVASDCLESISNFFQKVLSFFKEHCCCGKKTEEIGQATETSSMEGKEFTEEEIKAFEDELDAYFDENMQACVDKACQEELNKKFSEDVATLSEEQGGEIKRGILTKGFEQCMASFVASKGGKSLSLSEDDKKLIEELSYLWILCEKQIITKEEVKKEEEKLLRKIALCLIPLCK